MLIKNFIIDKTNDKEDDCSATKVKIDEQKVEEPEACNIDSKDKKT